MAHQPRTLQHAAQQMTREYNRTQAFAKIAMAPLDKLDDRMLESIARTHKVPVDTLRAQLADRRAREGHGG